MISSVNGDSEAECRGLSPAQCITNGYNKNFVSNLGFQNSNTNHVQNNFNNIYTTIKTCPDGSSGGATPKKRTEQAQCIGVSEAVAKTTNGEEGGSPLRSKLGLKLKKSNTPAAKSISPLECLLCNYKTESTNTLTEHINRTHFDPLSPSVNNNLGNGLSGGTSQKNKTTLHVHECPICMMRAFPSGSDLELHVNIEHKDILSPANFANGASAQLENNVGHQLCPICNLNFDQMTVPEMEIHIEGHFARTPIKNDDRVVGDGSKEARLREERVCFEMLRAQYGMDDQGNFREQSLEAMQKAVYAGEMSVADYYERQIGLRAAESHGIDDGTSCTKSVAARILSLSANAPGVTKSLICSGVDHYASNFGDKGTALILNYRI